MSEEQLVEPGGWLAEHQRANCTGATALTTYQGLIADEIVLPQSALEAGDPARLVQVGNQFVDALHNQAYFIAGEYAPEALWSMRAHEYVAQARAGGHAQYYAMRGGDLLTLRCASAGLKSMLADPHLDIFNLMVRLRRAKPRDAKRIAIEAQYPSVATALRDLDKRLADVEQAEPLASRQKAWLKSFRKTTFVPDGEVMQHMQRLLSANRLFAARRTEAEAIRAETQRTDPTYKAARSLCEMAGLQFVSLQPGAFVATREAWPEGPDRKGFGVRVDTNQGPRVALFYIEGALFKRRLAVLIRPGEVLPLGSLSLTPEEFAAIVPSA